MANFALDQAVSLIMLHDKKWEWDDLNQTDLPVATTTIVSGQQDYSVATTHLKVLEVKVKDVNGYYQPLEKVQTEEIEDYINQYTSSGMPKYYGVRGNSIFLIPAPSTAYVSATTGLRIYFQRGASYFAYDSTTKEPGIPSPFHRLVSLYPARDYCGINNLPGKKQNAEELIARLEAKLAEFFQDRAGDAPQRLSFDDEDYGQQELMS